MVSEDFVRQMANDLIRKLVKNPATTDKAQKAFIVFCEETTDLLRSKVIEALPNDEVIDTNVITEKIAQLSSCKALVLVAPSIDLAAKITTLQTDYPIAALVIKALFANKRVIAIATGPLAVAETLRVGLRKAVEDLRCKLAEMGIEFTNVTELAQIIEPLIIESPKITSKTDTKNLSQNLSDILETKQSTIALTAAITSPLANKNTFSSLPEGVYPISQHPSQIKLASKNELSEFVDFLQTKPCTMEKGKPCDHCDMCTTLGF
ncbi:MAG: hypothetical protein FD167_4979 [bacterium]|nr:MAG: hypothetical protein FD167_4979 [bacterium]